MDAEPPRKRRKGGLRQRLKQEEDQSEDATRCENSVLAMLLLNLFAWGFFSPQRVQQIAEMAVRDIERSKEDPKVLSDLYVLA